MQFIRSFVIQPSIRCRSVDRSSVILRTLSSFTAHPDKLYRKIELELRAHDNAVLTSYETFARTAAKELEIRHESTTEPWRHIYRRTLLRSIFVKKKYREQYEMRTHFRIVSFKHLTGSTADTFLEYLQRNLPEGVSMIVRRHQLEPLPDHLVPPTKETSQVESNENLEKSVQ